MSWFWQWFFSGERTTSDVPDAPGDNMVDFDPADFAHEDFG